VFKREALVLVQIGQRAKGRIPNLLAYFTEDRDHFFVIELVVGTTRADCIKKVGKKDKTTVRYWLGKML
jgi:hypothetical protein